MSTEIVDRLNKHVPTYTPTTTVSINLGTKWVNNIGNNATRDNIRKHTI